VFVLWQVAPPQEQEQEVEERAPLPPVVVAKHHHVVAGTPRNVASPPLQHPPMAAPHLAPGVPRIVALPAPHPHPQQPPPFFYHPTAHADGRPRTVGAADTRSAEDHVALRRKQLLPTPLQGIYK